MLGPASAVSRPRSGAPSASTGGLVGRRESSARPAGPRTDRPAASGVARTQGLLFARPLDRCAAEALLLEQDTAPHPATVPQPRVSSRPSALSQAYRSTAWVEGV